VPAAVPAAIAKMRMGRFRLCRASRIGRFLSVPLRAALRSPWRRLGLTDLAFSYDAYIFLLMRGPESRGRLVLPPLSPAGVPTESGRVA
jgi:hypothetical protein